MTEPAALRVLAEANPPFYKRHFAGLRAMIPRPLAIRLQSAIDSLHQPNVIDYDQVWQKIIDQPSP